jgi:hypothetical protein
MQMWRSFARSWASPIFNSPFKRLEGSRTYPGKARLSTPMKQAQNISFVFYGEALLE